MSTKEFDLIVLGAGPGGYVAAIAAAQRGKRVALVEPNSVGGTCLGRGCIPSKALLACAEALHKVRLAKNFGITVEGISFDYSKMKAHKDGVVSKIIKSLEGLIKANAIEIIRGYGKFISRNEVKVVGIDNVILKAPKTIIATGSEPLDIPAFPCDFKKIHNSTSMLDLEKLPKKLVIIGGGIIGSEFACLHAELGVEVTILEMLPHIISTEGTDASHALSEAFKKKGINIRTQVRVEKVETNAKGVQVHLQGGEKIDADMALVAVGRKMNTNDIGLDRIGLSTTDRGFINVNDHLETAVPGIYAIGDITGKWLLAHVASHQGIIAAKNACGERAHIHYDSIPSVVYTTPEIATVGLTPERAHAKGLKVKVGKYPFNALGKSIATQETDGFAQVVIDHRTHQILGAQVIGHGASMLIGQMGVAIQNELTVECLNETVHAHPTAAEAWLEAGLIAEGHPLHYPPLKKG